MSAFIQTIQTALPPFTTEQNRIADFMVRHLGLNADEEKQLRILYRASGIRKRHSVLADYGTHLNGEGFFHQGQVFPSAKPRMQLYQQHAVKLAARASEDAMVALKLQPQDITHLITISCTGMYAPGLDIELLEALHLPTQIQRTSINFMGCYAAFHGLRMVQQIIKSDPEARVLMVSVELCTLHLQDAKDEENLLANAIFGDGAAALIASAEPRDQSLKIEGLYSDLALQGKQEMGWFIGDYGFEMKLSQKVPDVIRQGINDLTEQLLSRMKMDFSEIDFFAIHPGGKRILEVIEEKLGISKEDNLPAREVLKQCGNMSSPTVLFVIKSILDKLTSDDHGKNLLSFAFGPGLTLESAILKAHIHA